MSAASAHLSDSLRAIRRIEKELYAYRYAIALIETDEATVAPSGGGAGRGETLETLSAAVYRLIAWDALPGLLDRAEAEGLDAQQAGEVRELRRQHDQIARIPAEAYAAGQRLFGDARAAWQKAKAAGDFAAFAPWLEKCVETRRRWAEHFAPGQDAYAAWLDQYQPGLTVPETEAFFARVRGVVVPLLRDIRQNGEAPQAGFLQADWPIAQQKQLSAYVMQVMGLSPAHCVLGETEHPFTQQLYDEDVRITTHYYPRDMTSNLFSVIHEGGHALYELHISPALRYTVLAEGSCIGLHESQSRLFENNIGRSLPFLRFLWPKLTELFPRQLRGVTAEGFYRAVNRVEPGPIRTTADEVSYPLHIMVRYELEKQLLVGTLAVRELPAAWNALYQAYLGVTVPDDAQGVLQDVHWSQGDFGYFPGYALGSAYAAQMVAQMRQAFDVDGCCRAGDLQPMLDFLTQRLWRYGKTFTPAQLIEKACGGKFSPHCYLDYLEQKYRALYRL